MRPREKDRHVLILGGTGYIGSRLFKFLEGKGYTVTSVDREWYGNPGIPNTQEDYRELPAGMIQEYGHVILLAGHSSVPMCRDSRRAAYENNVAGFLGLLEKLTPQQKFLYASSSGVYGGLGEKDCQETEERVRISNTYDLTKLAIDHLASQSGLCYYGLRFGTVNGWSPNFRQELMINKMVTDALATGEIHLSNPEVLRPILALGDLCSAVLHILDPAGQMSPLCSHHQTQPLAPGLYNLASFNLTVQQIAFQVQKELPDTRILLQPPSKTYNMGISTAKFEAATHRWRPRWNVQSLVRNIVEGLQGPTLRGDRLQPRPEL